MTTPRRAPTVAVVGADTGAGAALASGLEDRGASVARLPVSALEGRARFGAALQEVVPRLGALEGLVVASVGTEPTRGAAVADLDSDTWSAMVERPLQRTLVCFQGAFDVLRQAGGTMVLVVPTLSLVGAAGFGPWAAVTEGQRALARAAARAWGSRAVTVHCVAVPASLLTAAPTEDGPYPDRPGQPAPALHRPDMGADVSSVVHSLLSPAWRSVTGATVAVDGGVWMTP
ncbi:MAG TPA: SDR family oxidoreductase [Acidimicrobiales bacterium]